MRVPWKAVRWFEPTLLDATTALALFVAAEAEASFGIRPWSAHEAPWSVAALASVFQTVPVAWRRRRPVAALATILAAALVEAAVAAPPESLAVLGSWLLAVYSVGRYASSRVAVGALAGACMTASMLVLAGPGGALADYLAAIFVPCVPPWLGGALAGRHARAARLEEDAARLNREREARDRAVIAEERGRIGRELHDVVAHAVSTIVIQAQAGSTMLERDADAARTAFAEIEKGGRQALVELRRLLGLLRAGGGVPAREPQPSLAALDNLVEAMRRAGLPVAVTVEGSPISALPPGLELAAYRVVQEALTNALRHAGPARAQLTIRYHSRALELEVVDDGTGDCGASAGHGLIGMRERVALFGGELSAGCIEPHGFRVFARLPVAT